MLKIELKKIKEKNNFLQEKIKKIIDENVKDKDKNNKKDEIFENNYTMTINNTNEKNNNIGDCSLSEIKENKENNISYKKGVKQKNNYINLKIIQY